MLRNCKISLTLLIVVLALFAPTHKGRAPLSRWPRVVLADAAGQEQSADDRPLPAVGRAVTQALSTGEAHSYRLTLGANQYLHLTIEPQGVEADASLYGADGQPLIQLECRPRGPTPISFIAGAAGVYRLEVRAVEQGQTQGRYTLTVEESRPAAAGDEHRVAAETSFAAGRRLLKDWTEDSSRAAIQKFKDALSSWQAAGEPREEAYMLRRIGDVYQPLGEFESALDYYKQALALSRKANDWHGEAEALNATSYVYITQGSNQKALGLCAQALKLSRALGDRLGEAQALNNFGEVYYGFGKLQRSLEFYQQALPLWQELQDRSGQALTLLNFGYSYSDLGQVLEAFDFYQRALTLWQTVGDRRGEAVTEIAIGRLYSRVGENQEALKFFERAEKPIRLMGDPVWEAGTITGMAATYNALGEGRKALEYYERALQLFRDARHFSGEANTLGDAGGVYFSLGDDAKALEYHQRALSIFRTVGDRRMEIFELREIGRVHDVRGDKAMALDSYLTAREFYQAEKDLRGEADTLNLIGRVYDGRGETQRALESYQRALSLSRRAQYRFGVAATLYNLASLERARGNLTEARARIQEALEIVESLRTKVSSQDLRASYFASVRQHYELYIDILMRLREQHPAAGLDALAFEVSERARARSLLETLAESQGEIRQGVDPALLERERALRRQLNAKSERQMRLLGGPHRDEEAATLAGEIEAITNEYESVEAEIRATSPHYAALTQPEPLSAGEIQQRVLDDETLLLEYALGDERSYVWAVTRGAVATYELPGRARVEEAARRLYGLLTAHQPVAGESADERHARIAQADADYWREADALSDMILGPAAEHLKGQRLLIVADGALQYIPFGALATPGAEAADDGSRPPLFTRHEIVNLPSASILPVLQGEAASRKPGDKAVAVFADPVFERDDPRVVTSGGGMPSKGDGAERAEVHRALRDINALSDGEGIPRLMASREEAEAIASLLPPGEVKKVTDFGASRAAATEPGLARYRVLHFATHSLLNNEHPELSGIVLSLVDESGQPQDGFLRLQDIYNLKLSADLVVLSACNTGLGKDVRGEGLIGLTRGFMYAGAGTVVASLWKVDDEATAELMKHFYEGIFKRGLAPPAALREAQLAMWRQKRWRAPYYWAGFVIQGQYAELKGLRAKPLGFPGRLVAWGAVAAAILFAALYAARLRRKRRIRVAPGPAKT